MRHPWKFLLFLIAYSSTGLSFRRGRLTEVGMCTVTTSEGYETKISCLEGDANYCCDLDEKNQYCCTLEAFSERYRSLLLVMLGLIFLIAILFFVLCISNFTGIFMSLTISQEENALKDREKLKEEFRTKRKKVKR
ncbi:hypothetical protein HDE_13071 [Halotydeus destructor]|nr:hypothetical protein HDE_13071 [Halotydeus destructor]